MTKLATYGTLRNRRPDAVEGWIYGFKLFDTGNGFPAIFRAEDGFTPIKVDLFDCSDEHLEGFDRIEGIDSGLYVREEVVVYEGLTQYITGDDEVGTKAEIYVAGPMLMMRKEHMTEIEGGDWIEYRKEKGDWRYA